MYLKQVMLEVEHLTVHTNVNAALGAVRDVGVNRDAMRAETRGEDEAVAKINEAIRQGKFTATQQVIDEVYGPIIRKTNELCRLSGDELKQAISDFAKALVDESVEQSIGFTSLAAEAPQERAEEVDDIGEAIAGGHNRCP